MEVTIDYAPFLNILVIYNMIDIFEALLKYIVEVHTDFVWAVGLT